MDCAVFFLILFILPFHFIVLLALQKWQKWRGCKILNMYLFLKQQLTKLSLMGVFVEFFCGFVSSDANLLVTLVSIRTI